MDHLVLFWANLDELKILLLFFFKILLQLGNLGGKLRIGFCRGGISVDILRSPIYSGFYGYWYFRLFLLLFNFKAIFAIIIVNIWLSTLRRLVLLIYFRLRSIFLVLSVVSKYRLSSFSLFFFFLLRLRCRLWFWWGLFLRKKDFLRFLGIYLLRFTVAFYFFFNFGSFDVDSLILLFFRFISTLCLFVGWTLVGVFIQILFIHSIHIFSCNILS